MDENTRFLIERMDLNKADLIVEIKELRKDIGVLMALKNKLIGMALVAGGLGSALIEIVKAKLMGG